MCMCVRCMCVKFYRKLLFVPIDPEKLRFFGGNWVIAGMACMYNNLLKTCQNFEAILE